MNALEAADPHTRSDARWVADAALLVGRELKLDRVSLKRLELGALLCDIGELGVPSAILGKPGPLTAAERRIVQEHAALGDQILQPIARLSEVRPIVRACHERWDGQGYPDGTPGVEIPLEARIVFVCDTYRAMVSDRPYRARLLPEEALRQIGEAAGTEFDPRVVAAFALLHRDGAIDPS